MGKITVVGNYVDIPKEDNINLGGENDIITFVGKMNYEPNVLAVQYFSKEILPEICDRFKDIRFYIVGASPDKRVKALDQLPNIKVTGFVEKIEPYLINSALVVAPMLTGSGIQNKIIQSMAHSCCVITTSIGAEGLAVEESGLTVCNSNEEWKTNVINLLRNKDLRQQLGRKARKYIINTMSKDIVRKQFYKFLNITIQ